MYFRVEPVYMGDPSNLTDFSSKIENTLNRKFNTGNIYFKALPTSYKTPYNTTVSFLTYLEENYDPMSIKVLIFPDSISFIEEKLKPIQGAALGIPDKDNPSTGKPILFIRESKINDVLNHEMGHVFGLYHTFEGNDTDNKGLNCETGDEVPTTITPDPEGSFYIHECDYFIPKHKKDKYTKEEIQNMVENPMGYAAPYCMKDLNKEQFQKIRKMVEKNSRLQDCLLKLEK